jgi:hypothetical protein
VRSRRTRASVTITVSSGAPGLPAIIVGRSVTTPRSSSGSTASGPPWTVTTEDSGAVQARGAGSATV